MFDEKNPVAVDTALAAVYQEKFELERQVDRLRQRVEYYQDNSYYANKIPQVESEIRGLVEKLGEVFKEVRRLEAFYTGWSRAYLVSNTNGHIHSSTDCSTCFIDTRFVWLTDLSGQDRLEIAGLAGERACSVCFPDAPSEYFLRKCQLEDPAVVKAREERNAAKAVREAKRIAIGITNPDGSPVKVRRQLSKYLEELKTERTAQIWLVDSLFWIAEFDEVKQSHQIEWKAILEEDVEMVLIALAFKRGQEVAEVRAELQDKVAKKIVQRQRELEKWYVKNPQYRPTE
jgi:hypothetical protein